jgi:hypothetical protein
MVPSEAFQVTALFVVVPNTVAWKAIVLLVNDAAEPGEIATEVTVPADAAPLANTL